MYNLIMDLLESKKVFLVWKTITIVIFGIVLIHFLKDITQDFLGVATILDRLGAIHENISGFSKILRQFYDWAMFNTYIVEFILLFTIPKTWKQKTFSKIDILNLGLAVYLAVGILFAWLLATYY